MTIDQTWKNCLRMWKWINTEWKPGMKSKELKEQWFEKFWRDKKQIELHCFFCEYHIKHDSLGSIREADRPLSQGCQHCPGVLVNKCFHCERKSYNWWGPKTFYKKLLQLDAKRRAKT